MRSCGGKPDALQPAAERHPSLARLRENAMNMLRKSIENDFEPQPEWIFWLIVGFFVLKAIAFVFII